MDHLSMSDKWVSQHVSKGVEALARREWQLSLEVEYVWNGDGAKVWRNNRLPRDPVQLAALLVDAKEALIPILKRRGLPV